MTTTKAAETAHIKTNEEFEDEFGNLHELEIKRQGKLNETLFAMGDLLNRWQPNDVMIRKLAKQFDYTVVTLQQRMYAAREIPPKIRNSRLSFSAHIAALDVRIPDDDDEQAEVAQATREELITGADEKVTANKMRALVRDKRMELGQITLPDRPFGKGTQRPRGGVQTIPALQARMARLGRAGGLAISDQHGIVKVSAAFEEEDGDVTITIENTSDYVIEPALHPVNGRPRKFTVTYTLADAKPDDDAGSDDAAEGVEA